MKSNKIAIIIGAGPAGLTAAYELATKTNIKPIVIEREPRVGGIAATLSYKGNLLDIGGHRFFTKSDRVLNWWLSFLPIKSNAKFPTITYQNKSHVLKNIQITKSTDAMLIRKRKSRIYYEGNYFDYPLKLNRATFQNLGGIRTVSIAKDYLKSKVIPIQPEITLEDFLINRFGNTLYKTFFKTYTEKVWGKNCSDLQAEWGHQRIKGLSLTKSILHALASHTKFTTDTESTLSEFFLYPTKGPGQLWNTVAREAEKKGAQIFLDHAVTKLHISSKGKRVASVVALHNGKKVSFSADYVISTMAIDDLGKFIVPKIPSKISNLTDKLTYRSFIVVGLLIPKSQFVKLLIDNWIYIHDPSVKVGRIQIFNNWSPKLVKDKRYYWVGMEYFCNYNDDMWKLSDKEHLKLAMNELLQLKIIHSMAKVDGMVVRIQKAYPVYDNTYVKGIKSIQKYFNEISNLYLIGRNGMHRYNNQDHSGLAAMIAVDLIVNNKRNKNELWDINTDTNYHEEK